MDISKLTTMEVQIMPPNVDGIINYSSSDDSDSDSENQNTNIVNIGTISGTACKEPDYWYHNKLISNQESLKIWLISTLNIKTSLITKRLIKILMDRYPIDGNDGLNYRLFNGCQGVKLHNSIIKCFGSASVQLYCPQFGRIIVNVWVTEHKNICPLDFILTNEYKSIHAYRYEIAEENCQHIQLESIDFTKDAICD